MSISKGPAGPQDIRWNAVPGTARCFRCIDFYQPLTPCIYEKYLAPKYDCFEGTVIRERTCPKSGQDLVCPHPVQRGFTWNMDSCLGTEWNLSLPHPHCLERGASEVWKLLWCLRCPWALEDEGEQRSVPVSRNGHDLSLGPSEPRVCPLLLGHPQ